MAAKSLDESNRLFAVEIDMENRSPDEIAKDAALQIIAIFDRLNKEQKEKMIKTLYEIFQHWSVKGSVYLLSDLHLNDDDCLLMDPNWIPPDEQIWIINNKVTRSDTFICLGDVGSAEYAAQIKAGHKVLLLGNEKYLLQSTGSGDVSPAVRLRTSMQGQQPYAIIITCSDSRVIPECVFSAGIGELFVIRVAGNVIDDHQLGSIEYAVEHLGTNLVVMMGHTGCGAVEAAIHHDPSGFIKYITDGIRDAIGEETDPYRAACLNVEHSIKQISDTLDIDHLRHGKDPAVIGAIYHIDSGEVRFLHTDEI